MDGDGNVNYEEFVTILFKVNFEVKKYVKYMYVITVQFSRYISEEKIQGNIIKI